MSRRAASPFRAGERIPLCYAPWQITKEKGRTGPIRLEVCPREGASKAIRDPDSGTFWLSRGVSAASRGVDSRTPSGEAQHPRGQAIGCRPFSWLCMRAPGKNQLVHLMGPKLRIQMCHHRRGQIAPIINVHVLNRSGPGIVCNPRGVCGLPLSTPGGEQPRQIKEELPRVFPLKHTAAHGAAVSRGNHGRSEGKVEVNTMNNKITL